MGIHIQIALSLDFNNKNSKDKVSLMGKKLSRSKITANFAKNKES